MLPHCAESALATCSLLSSSVWPRLVQLPPHACKAMHACLYRLASGGLRHAATLCWICAGNVELTVKHWLSSAGQGGSIPVPALQVRQLACRSLCTPARMHADRQHHTACMCLCCRP